MNDTQTELPADWTLSASDDLTDTPQILRHGEQALGTVRFSPNTPAPTGAGGSYIAARFVWAAGTEALGFERGYEIEYDNAMKALLTAAKRLVQP